MERVGEHAVPVGPLAVRWLAYELEEARAGVAGHARLQLENAGTAPWRSRGREGIQVAYHWLDPLGNPIVWDGIRTALPRTVEPSETVEVEMTIVAPRPQGSYRLAFDLVEEHRFWFQEIGSTTLDVPVDVKPRIAERRLQVVLHGPPDAETAAALAAQEEPLADGRRVRVRASRSRRLARAGLVAARARRARRGIRGGRPGARSLSRRSTPVRRMGSGRRSQPSLRRAAATPITPRRARTARRGRAAVLFGGRLALRRPCGRQTSTAIRSSERLKTNAPAASPTTAATAVYSVSESSGSSP